MERIPILRLLVTSVSTGLASIALVTFFRRLSAASLRDLPAGEMVVYTSLYAVVCFTVSRLLVDQFSSSWGRASLPSVSSLVLTLFLLAGLSAVPLTLLIGLLVAGTVVGLMTLTAHLEASQSARGNRTRQNVAPPQPISPVEPLEAVHEDVGLAANSQVLDEPLVTFTRSDTDAGDRIAGSIRFETASGETAKTLHVPLWPPLAGVPSVQCELTGIEGRVSVPYAKSHGFRIEVRLPEAVDEPMEGTVQFVAECVETSAAA